MRAAVKLSVGSSIQNQLPFQQGLINCHFSAENILHVFLTTLVKQFADSYFNTGEVRGQKGLTQKEQIEVVRKFKYGGYNTIVATYVEEESLDIGEVDLIVLYDVVKSLCVSMYK